LNSTRLLGIVVLGFLAIILLIIAITDTPSDTTDATTYGIAIFTILEGDEFGSENYTLSVTNVLQKHLSAENTTRNVASEKDKTKGNYIIQSIRVLDKESRNPDVNATKSLFERLESERKMITVQSLDNLTKAFSFGRTYANVTHILYDIEHWEQTPQEEKNAPVDSISIGSHRVHSEGFKYGITPDAVMLLENYKEIDWTEIDLVGMQLQRFSQNITLFSQHTKTVSDHVRAINPSIEIYVQLSFRFTAAEDMISAINSVRPYVDGYVVSYLPRGQNCPNCNIDALETVLREISQDSNERNL